MVTIILGTNRHLSKTAEIGNIYSNILTDLNIAHQVLNLEGRNFFTRNEEMKAIEQEFLIATEKFIFILPEYNGSFPGVLKLLMDNSDIRKAWWFKKAMLVGLADGRGGNLRGLDHLTTILQYLKMNVFYQKVMISRVSEVLQQEDNTIDPQILEEIHSQIEGFMAY